MFTEMHLKNFKGWVDTKPIRLAPITVFFGTNSSGKTSLLQSILLLKQTAESSDRTRVLHPGDARSLVDLGTPSDFIYGHDGTRALEIDVTWTVPAAVPPERPVSIGDKVITTLSFGVDVRLNPEGQPFVEQLHYEGAGARIGLVRKEDKQYELQGKGVALRRRPGRPWPLPPPVRFYGLPDEAVNYYQGADWLPDLALALERQLGRVHYVGPLREYPHRSYLWAGEQPVNVGTRGENAVPALLAARTEKRIGHGEGKRRRYTAFDVMVAQWLEKMGVIDSFRVVQVAKNRKDYEVRVKRTSQSAEVYITDVGFGVSQLLPVLVQCYYAAPSSTIIFEQPEIHLHPKVAADLADVIIDAMIACDVQFIIESHSEHFLQRLQRRVAEAETIDETKVALYSCDVVEGQSRISDLELDELGNIRKWPKDFFGDPMGEAAARTMAAIRRKKKA